MVMSGSEVGSDPLPGSLDISMAQMELSWASAALSSRRGADYQAERQTGVHRVSAQTREKPYRSSDSEDMVTASNAICLILLHYDTEHDCLPILTHKRTWLSLFSIDFHPQRGLSVQIWSPYIKQCHFTNL